MHASGGNKQLVNALLYRASVPLRRPFNELPSALQQQIVRDVAIPLRIFIPDNTSENGGKTVTRHANKDISVFVGIVSLVNKTIFKILSRPKDISKPFDAARFGFPVIWFGDNAISCGVIRQAEGSTVEVPLRFRGPKVIIDQTGRVAQFSEPGEGTFTVNVSNGISLIFTIRPIQTQLMTTDATHVTQGTFTVHLTRIQVTAIPNIPNDEANDSSINEENAREKDARQKVARQRRWTRLPHPDPPRSI